MEDNWLSAIYLGVWQLLLGTAIVEAIGLVTMILQMLDVI